MGLIGRIYEFAAGTKIVASEMNAEIDNIHDEINGSLTDVNVHAAAGVLPTKIDDSSNTVILARTESNPGNSAVPQLPVSIEGELQKMRWKIRENGVGRSVFFTDDAAAKIACGWQERAAVGQNLLVNSSFETQTAGAGEAPDGWDLAIAPTTVTIQTTAVTEGTGNDVAITASAAASGIEQTVSNVKANAYYLVGCRLKATSGTAHIFTTGGLPATNHYQNFDFTTVSGTYSTVAGVVRATAVPASIVVSITGGANTHALKADHAFMYELGDGPIGDDLSSALVMPTPVQTTHVTRDATTNDDTNTYLSTTISSLADRPSYIEVTGYVHVSMEAGGTSSNVEITLERDIDGAASWADVAGRFPCASPAVGPVSIPIHFIDWSPGLDESHEFRIKIFNNGGVSDVWINGFNSPASALWVSALTAVVRPKT